MSEKYCCEKCFCEESSLHRYVVDKSDKTGDCKYCGSTGVKIIEASKMRDAIYDVINKWYQYVESNELDDNLPGEPETFHGEFAHTREEILEEEMFTDPEMIDYVQPQLMKDIWGEDNTGTEYFIDK